MSISKVATDVIGHSSFLTRIFKGAAKAVSATDHVLEDVVKDVEPGNVIPLLRDEALLGGMRKIIPNRVNGTVIEDGFKVETKVMSDGHIWEIRTDLRSGRQEKNFLDGNNIKHFTNFYDSKGNLRKELFYKDGITKSSGYLYRRNGIKIDFSYHPDGETLYHLQKGYPDKSKLLTYYGKNGIRQSKYEFIDGQYLPNLTKYEADGKTIYDPMKYFKAAS